MRERVDDVSSATEAAPEPLGKDLRLAAAIRSYSAGEISQEQAARSAGLNRAEFLDALAREKVDVFVVDFDDLEKELERVRTARSMWPAPRSPIQHYESLNCPRRGEETRR